MQNCIVVTIHFDTTICPYFLSMFHLSLIQFSSLFRSNRMLYVNSVDRLMEPFYAGCAIAKFFVYHAMTFIIDIRHGMHIVVR